MRLPGRRAGGLALIILLALALVLFLGGRPILKALGHYLVLDEPPQHADAIVVLGGDEWGTRILKAAALEKAGYAPVVLVSGPSWLLGHESDVVIEYARRHGYPPSMFRAFPHNSDSTKQEARLIGQTLRRESIHKILLVTSNFHTRRATKIFHDQAPWLEVHPIAAPDRYFDPDHWWETRPAQKVTFYEWLKTISYALGD